MVLCAVQKRHNNCDSMLFINTKYLGYFHLVTNLLLFSLEMTQTQLTFDLSVAVLF